MIKKLFIINKDQRGSTLLEMLVIMAVAGLIFTAATSTIFQIFNGSTRSSNHMAAVRQVQDAGHWVSRDGSMAQVVTTGASNGFPLTLIWIDWAGVQHQVVYSISGTDFQRAYSQDVTLVNSGTIARYISAAQFNWDGTGGKLTFTVTATLGTGAVRGSETRIYEVIPRPWM